MHQARLVGELAALSVPLFTSGTARGGTNLLAQILSVNEEISLSVDPFLPLFRQLRNAVLLASDDSEVSGTPDAPFDDYYFSPIKLRAMHYIQKAKLDIPYDDSQHLSLLEATNQRMMLSSGELVPHLDMLSGRTFIELFASALRIVEKGRNAEECRWVGFNENWAVEFFAPLARAFPEARFIIILRDPRSSIASALRERDLTRVPHVMSFARGWRKYAAFASHFSRETLFDDRLYVLKYEQLVQDPEHWARQIAQFLDVSFDPAMLDTDNFRDASGQRWQGNSHFDPPKKGIYTTSIDAWKTYLPTEVIEAVEFVGDPDMSLFGYPPSVYSAGSGPSLGCLEFLSQDGRECQGWRTDSGDLEMDVGGELFRKTLLMNHYRGAEEELIQRCFLFKEVYLDLLNQTTAISTLDPVSSKRGG